jgi:chaperone required for assembly of F1-ATPase
MSWKPKRFWSLAAVQPCENGFAIMLDKRPAKTPGRLPLVVPTMAMAREIAAEWNAQTGLVRPETMPCTRSANSALEKVTPQFAEVVNLLAAYGDSDLLCYRAIGPVELVALQKAAWDPLLEWSASELKAPLATASGVMHIPQPAASTSRLHSLVSALTPFELAAFHDLVMLSGSLVLAFAVTSGRLSPAEAWKFSRIDEDYQISLWGEDDEATTLAEGKRAAFHHAAAFWAMCRPEQETGAFSS